MLSLTKDDASYHDEAINAALRAVFWKRAATFVVVLKEKSAEPVSTALLDGFKSDEVKRIRLENCLVIDKRLVDFDAVSDRGLWHGGEVIVNVTPSYSKYCRFSRYVNLRRDTLIMSVTGNLTISGVRELFAVAKRLKGVCYYIGSSEHDPTRITSPEDMEAVICLRLEELGVSKMDEEGGTYHFRHLMRRVSDPATEISSFYLRYTRRNTAPLDLFQAKSKSAAPDNYSKDFDLCNQFDRAALR